MNGILLDPATGDLQGSNTAPGGKATLALGNIDAQVTEQVLRAYPGEYKEAPTLGAHVTDLLHGTPSPFWKGDTLEMLQSQLINASAIEIDGNTITIK